MRRSHFPSDDHLLEDINFDAEEWYTLEEEKLEACDPAEYDSENSENSDDDDMWDEIMCGMIAQLKRYESTSHSEQVADKIIKEMAYSFERMLDGNIPTALEDPSCWHENTMCFQKGSVLYDLYLAVRSYCKTYQLDLPPIMSSVSKAPLPWQGCRSSDMCPRERYYIVQACS